MPRHQPLASVLYPRIYLVVAIVLARTALAATNGLVVFDQLNATNPLTHLEPEHRLAAQPQWRTVRARQRMAIHFVGQNRLFVQRAFEGNRLVELLPSRVA